MPDYQFAGIGDDAGAPLFEDAELGEIAGDCTEPLEKRYAAAAELLRRFLAEATMNGTVPLELY